MDAFTINVPPYDGELTVIYNKDADEVKSFIKENSKEFDDKDLEFFMDGFEEMLESGHENSGFLYTNGGIGAIYLFEHSCPKKLLKTLVHELTHYVFFLMNGPASLQLTEDTHEPYCYMLDYLTGECVSKLGFSIER